MIGHDQARWIAPSWAAKPHQNDLACSFNRDPMILFPPGAFFFRDRANRTRGNP
jgi:hypothetical protein